MKTFYGPRRIFKHHPMRFINKYFDFFYLCENNCDFDNDFVDSNHISKF